MKGNVMMNLMIMVTVAAAMVLGSDDFRNQA